MLFSSTTFLYLFLPIVLFCYYALLKWSRRLQNFFLLIVSLLFYTWGEKLVLKGDIMIIKTKEGSLVEQHPEFSEEDIRPAIEKLTELQQCAQKNGASFLYVSVPDKGINFVFPDNVKDYSAENMALFLDALENAQIPVLDVTAEMENSGILNSNAYFATDHHWKPEIGFWASGKICEALHQQYGFSYDPETTNLENYSVRVYEDWFLGSYGKKVGLHFTNEGADDISLITPKFETNLTELQPYKDHERTGTFEETVLYLENIDTKDYYSLNAYAAYSGGDFRLQVLKNNLLPDGKKIVILRDSFACTVTPFLALNAGEIHCIDVRDMLPTEDINVYTYIEEIKPDYVLVLYSGAVADAYDRLDLD